MNIGQIKELGFTKWCINNSTSVYIFTIIICLAGYIAYERIPKELFPDIVVPTISIATIYPGATPQDVENLISKPIENLLMELKKSVAPLFLTFLW